MNLEFIKNHAMANNLETHWIPIVMNTISQKRISKASSLQIYWNNVLGTLNGFINLYMTNDFKTKSLVATYNINTISNKLNSILIELNPIYGFIKLEYSKNQIMAGQLNAILNYVEV